MSEPEKIRAKVWSMFGDLPKVLLRAFAWNHLAKILEYLFLYVFSVMVARSLGPVNNGIYATLISVAQLLLVLSSAGLDQALSRFLPEYLSANDGSKIRYIIQRLLHFKLLAILLPCSLVILLWPMMSGWVNIQPAPVQFLLVIVMLGASRSVTSFLSGIWLSQLRPKVPFLINTSIPLLQIIALAALSSARPLLNMVLLIVLTGGVLSMLSNAIAARRYLRQPTETVPIRPVLTFSGWLWINAIVAYILGKQGDIVMLSLFSVPKASVGSYDVAVAFSQLPGFVVAAGMSGILLSMFSHVARQTPAGTLPLWITISRVTTQALLPVYIFLVAFSDSVIPLVYSAQYLDALPFLQVLLVARIIARSFGGGENFDALLATNAERPAVILSACAGSVNFLLNLLLIPPYGALGAAMATGTAMIAADVSSWVLLRGRIGSPFLLKNWTFSFLLGAIPVIAAKSLCPSPGHVQLIVILLICILLWLAGIVVWNRSNSPRT